MFLMIKWSMPLLASDKLFIYYLVLNQHVYYKHVSSSASLMCMWTQLNSMLLFGFNGKLKHHHVWNLDAGVEILEGKGHLLEGS